ASQAFTKAFGGQSVLKDVAGLSELSRLISSSAFRSSVEAVAESVAADLIAADTSGDIGRTGTLTLAQQRECVAWIVFFVVLSFAANVLLEARLRFNNETTFALDLLGMSGLYVAVEARKLARRVFDWMYLTSEDDDPSEN
ncbi:hypothetical protein ACFQ07_05960, partial [Actinomadura adrarensis]